MYEETITRTVCRTIRLREYESIKVCTSLERTIEWADVDERTAKVSVADAACIADCLRLAKSTMKTIRDSESTDTVPTVAPGGPTPAQEPSEAPKAPRIPLPPAYEPGTVPPFGAMYEGEEDGYPRTTPKFDI